MSSQPQALDASKLQITLTQTPRDVPAPGSSASSGCTDHMITADWTVDQGWDSPQLVPYGPMPMMPSASVFHYATECYEGMKLYRGYDGRLRLFRPLLNCARLVRSADRISLPSFDLSQLLQLIQKLCATDGPRWLPKDHPGSFLYIRPTLIGTDASLGFRTPQAARLFIIISCWATIRTTGSAGLRLIASHEGATRAWPGGTGASKVGANYGPTLRAHSQALEKGFDQVLWVFGKEHEVTESGSSNFFIIWKTPAGNVEVVTSPLEKDLILPGVTRTSILALLNERLCQESTWRPDSVESVTAVEKTFTMGEILTAAEEERLLGAFAVGTAYFVTPVSYIDFHGQGIDVPVEKTDYVSLLQKWMSDIMYGKCDHEWADIIDECE